MSETKPLPMPSQGGRYTRDPVTGELTAVEIFDKSPASMAERRAARERARAANKLPPVETPASQPDATSNTAGADTSDAPAKRGRKE